VLTPATWSAAARLSGLKDKDQKAERAVVYALGSGWPPVGRGSFPDRGGHGRRA